MAFPLNRPRLLVVIAVVLSLVAAALVGILAIGPSLPVLSASTGPVEISFGRIDPATGDPIVNLATDGVAIVPILVTSPDIDSALSGNVAVFVEFPAGVEFLGAFNGANDADAGSPESIAPESIWNCRSQSGFEESDSEVLGTVVECAASITSETPILPAGTSMTLLLMVETSGSDIDREIVTARASIAGISDDAFAQARIVDLGAGMPFMFGQTSGDVFLQAGSTGNASMSVINLGSGAAVNRDGVSVTVHDVFPDQLVSKWSVAGNGWDCEGPVSGPVDCVSSLEIAVGERLPPLELEWEVDEIAGSVPGGDTALIEWDSRVSANGEGGTDPGVPNPRVMFIAPPPPASLHVVANSLGSDHLVPGQTVTFDVLLSVETNDVTNAELDVSLPAGIQLVMAGEYDCENYDGGARCDVGFIPSGSDEQIPVTVTAGEEAAPGPAFLNLEFSAPFAEPDVDSYHLIVADQADPMIAGRLAEITESGLVVVADGRDLDIHEDESARFALQVHNIGPVDIDAGRVVTVLWYQERGTGVANVVSPSGEPCVSPTSEGEPWTCEFPLEENLRRGDFGPFVEVSLSGSGPRENINLGRFTFDIDVEGHIADELEVGLDIEENASHLRPRMEISSSITSGGSGVISVWLETLGARTEATPTFTASFPSGVHPKPAADSGCATDGSKLVCTFGRIAGGSESERRDVRIDIDAAAGTHMVSLTAQDLRSNGTVADRTDHTIEVPLIIAEPLEADVVAVPSIVRPRKDGEATVVMLKATSVSLDGHSEATSGWRQRCLEESDVGVVEGCATVTGSLLMLDDEHGSVRRVLVPHQSAATTYSFEYVLSDGEHSVSEFVTVTASSLYADARSVEERSASIAGGAAATNQQVQSVTLPLPEQGADLGYGFTLTQLEVPSTTQQPIEVSGTIEKGNVSWDVSLSGRWNQSDFERGVEAPRVESWTIDISNGAGDLSVSPIDGVSIDFTKLAGTLSSNGEWSLRSSLRSDYALGPVKFGSTHVFLNGKCSQFGTADVDSQCSFTFDISGEVDVDSDIDPTGLIASGGWQMEASIDSAGNVEVSSGGDQGVLDLPFGFKVRNPRFVISNNAGGQLGDTSVSLSDQDVATQNGWSSSLSGDITFAGASFGVVAEYLDGGPLIVIDALSGIPMAANANLSSVFVVNGTDGNRELGVQGRDGSFNVGDGSQLAVGDLTVPDWFGSITGSSAATVPINGESSPGDTSLSVQIAGDFGLNGLGDAVAIDFTDFRLELDHIASQNQWSIGIGGSAKFSISEPEDMRSSFEVEVDISTDGFSTISGTLTAGQGTGWRDAFGIKGVVLSDVVVGLQYHFGPRAEEAPSVGLHATVELPDSVLGPLSIKSGTEIAATVHLSETNPCLDIEIGNVNGFDETTISLGGGILTASHASLIAAPTGCTVGSIVIDPGFALAFDGKILGDDVSVNAKLEFTPKFYLDASVDLGAFSLADFHFSDTKLLLKTDDESIAVGFQGGVRIGNSEVDVTGQFEQDGDTTSISGTVDIPTLDLGILKLADVELAMQLTDSPASSSSAFSGRGRLDILGADIDVEKFDIEIKNQLIEQVTIEVNARIPLDTITFNGAFTGHYDAVDGSQNSFTGDVSAITASGITLADGTLNISESSAAFTANVNFEPTFSAELSGEYIYADPASPVTIKNAEGESVSGKKGDFYFSVDHLQLSVDGFDADGSFKIGNIAGREFSSVDATLRIGNRHDGAIVDITGEMKGDGSYSFTGTGAFTIADWDGLKLDITASSDGRGSASVEGSGSIALDSGLTIQIGGGFANDNGFVSTTLLGSASGALGGFDVGKIAVTVEQSPTSSGVSGEMDVAAGPIAASGHVSFFRDGAEVLFDASLKGSLDLPGLSAGAGIGFGNCSDPCKASSGYHFDISAHLCYSSWCWDHDWGVDTGGGFKFELQHNGDFRSGTANFDVVKAYIEGRYDAKIVFSDSGVNASANGEVSVHYRVWPDGWDSFGVGVSFEFNPFRACSEGKIVGVHWHLCA